MDSAKVEQAIADLEREGAAPPSVIVALRAALRVAAVARALEKERDELQERLDKTNGEAVRIIHQLESRAEAAERQAASEKQRRINDINALQVKGARGLLDENRALREEIQKLREEKGGPK